MAIIKNLVFIILTEKWNKEKERIGKSTNPSEAIAMAEVAAIIAEKDWYLQTSNLDLTEIKLQRCQNMRFKPLILEQ